MSCDLALAVGPDRPMARDEAEEYREDFIGRTKRAREASGLTQAEVGVALGNIGQDTWKQYETRTPLPHHLIPRFCLLVRCDIIWLLTGKGHAPDPAGNSPLSRAQRTPRARRPS